MNNPLHQRNPLRGAEPLPRQAGAGALLRQRSSVSRLLQGFDVAPEIGSGGSGGIAAAEAARLSARLAALQALVNAHEARWSSVDQGAAAVLQAAVASATLPQPAKPFTTVQQAAKPEEGHFSVSNPMRGGGRGFSPAAPARP